MRQFYLILIILTLVNSPLSAKFYTSLEIKYGVENQQVLEATQDFVYKFFIVKSPSEFIDGFLNNSKLDENDSLIIEYQLNQLLDEISFHSKQEFLSQFIQRMKHYQPQATRLHEEGNLEISVYNLQAKARGIENIWLVAESYNKYTYLFNVNPLKTLKELKGRVNFLSQPEWLGLKRSITDISSQNQIIIANYLLEKSKNLEGLDKFVSRYALITMNDELLTLGVNRLNVSNREYLLRHISEYFEKDFVFELLLNAAKNSPSKSFAMTMLKPYVEDNEKVQIFLIKSLGNKDVSKQAAFVISGIENIKVINKLETNYFNSTSELQKQNILLALKLSSQEQSKVVLNRIKLSKTSTIQNDGSAK